LYQTATAVLCAASQSVGAQDPRSCADLQLHRAGSTFATTTSCAPINHCGGSDTRTGGELVVVAVGGDAEALRAFRCTTVFRTRRLATAQSGSRSAGGGCNGRAQARRRVHRGRSRSPTAPFAGVARSNHRAERLELARPGRPLDEHPDAEQMRWKTSCSQPPVCLRGACTATINSVAGGATALFPDTEAACRTRTRAETVFGPHRTRGS